MRQTQFGVSYVSLLSKRMPVKDAYAYNERRKFKCLQKLCINILRKLRCQHFEDVPYVRRVAIDTNRIINNLHKQHNMLLGTYNLEPQHIYMGSKQFSELMQQEGGNMIDMPISFKGNYSIQKERELPTIMGVSFTVLPYLDGVIMVPETKLC